MKEATTVVNTLSLPGLGDSGSEDRHSGRLDGQGKGIPFLELLMRIVK
jgi:fructose 1,6-bisphosphatase